MKVDISDYPSGDADRKINVRIDPFDTWSLDHTLSIVILPALIQLKDTKQGIPSEFVGEGIGGDLDNNHCFDFIKEDADQVFDKQCEKWEETLNKMIWSFLQLSIADDYDEQYYHGNPDFEWKELEGKTYPNPVTGVNEPLYEMVNRNRTDYWYDRVGHDLHCKRIQEGLDLFSKYFLSLWD